MSAQRKIMLDSKSLGIRPNAVILSSGAFEFTKDAPVNRFHHHVDIEDCHQLGMQIEPRALMHWLEQPESERFVLINAKVSKLSQVLFALSNTFDWRGAEVWSTREVIANLEYAYELCKITPPWKFYHLCDFNTLLRMRGWDNMGIDDSNPFAQAKAQANVVIELTEGQGNAPYSAAA